MSKVTGIILTCSVAESQARDDGFPDRQLAAWLNERGYGALTSVEGSVAGWHPGCKIMIGGYNHFAESDFEGWISSLPWAYPENVILVLEPDDGPSRVTRPEGYGS